MNINRNNNGDVIKEFFVLLSRGGNISKTSENFLSTSGLPYYYVEITFNDGKQFVLQAFEEEAISLYECAKEILEGEK